MCGIVGIRLKTSELESSLGALVVPMLDALTARGPDSTGVAIYSRDIAEGSLKYSLCAPDLAFDWEHYGLSLTDELGSPVELTVRGRHCVAVSTVAPDRFLEVFRKLGEHVHLFGQGAAVEVYKDVGPSLEVCERYGIGQRSGYQAIGHTRMATESAVTTEHSHPFAVGADLALVHNGSFSNYASVRRDLVASGIVFDTDNDTEVAARFIGLELAGGADLDEALRRVLKVFDGFYTLLVASGDSIAIVRDSFACKPMVVAETDDYVAVASEYIAIADLPGIEKANVFEPMPEEIYTW